MIHQPREKAKSHICFIISFSNRLCIIYKGKLCVNILECRSWFLGKGATASILWATWTVLSSYGVISLLLNRITPTYTSWRFDPFREWHWPNMKWNSFCLMRTSVGPKSDATGNPTFPFFPKTNAVYEMSTYHVNYGLLVPLELLLALFILFFCGEVSSQFSIPKWESLSALSSISVWGGGVSLYS